MYAGHFQTSAITKGAAADELAHGHLLCVCIQVVVDCDPSLAGCKGRILSQGESLSIQHLVQFGKILFYHQPERLCKKCSNLHCHDMNGSPSDGCPCAVHNLPSCTGQSHAVPWASARHLRPSPFFACCRHTLAFSVWSSIHTSSFQSIRRPSWRCTGARSAMKCHLTCMR